jgi:hypothetical protein
MKEFYDDKLKDFIVCANELIDVESVKPSKDWTLKITFSNGKKKVYNFLPLLKKDIYKPLRNIVFFMKAKVGCGGVKWSDDLDIAPEELYKNGKEI